MTEVFWAVRTSDFLWFSLGRDDSLPLFNVEMSILV